jgi:excinuclease ABC subunit A
MDKPYNKLTKKERDIVLYGSLEPLNFEYTAKNGNKRYATSFYEGVITNLERRYMETKSDWIREWLDNYMMELECPVCHGTRFNRETLDVKYKEKNISDVLNMRVKEALEFFENVPKIKNKLQVMMDVGLSYIELGQSAPTLSGGEAGRVKLAKELQKKATGNSVFILDEPTTGLHSDDIKKLIQILQRIVDNGDTVIVIEHNLDVIKVADYIIDLGPEGGDQGGTVVATGTPEDITKVKESYTGEWLRKVL